MEEMHMAKKNQTAAAQKSAAVKQTAYDLSKSADLEQFSWDCQNGVAGVADIAERADFKTCLRDGTKSPLRHGRMSLTYLDGHESLTIVEKNGRVFAYSDAPQYVVAETEFAVGDDETPAGVVLTADMYSKRLAPNKGWVSLALINADEDEFGDALSLVNDFNDSAMPLVSFECLREMLDKKYAREAADMVATGRLVLLDYTPEETIDMTEDERAMLKSEKRRKGLKPPALGYSMLYGKKWHRSGFCLFRDAKKGTCYIFGQDEGSYFGCELPGTPGCTTVSAALAVLTPKEAQNKMFKRQGEWFAVPVAEAEVPGLLDLVMQADTAGGVFLPLETKDSNRHHLDGSVRIAKDGTMYFKGHVEHDEHSTLDLTDGWHRFYRNTAVRSVSTQGVD
jgi:hypothetical protein